MRTKKITLVLGMHRSGTSITAAALKALGATLGDTIEGTVDNPKGYFENKRITRLNEKILASLGYRWDTILYSEKSVNCSNINWQFSEEAKDIVSHMLATSDWVVIKDPRMCLLLEFWYDIFFSFFKKVSIEHIVIYRNPLEVAMSERARSSKIYHFYGAKLSHTLRLWLLSYHEVFKHLTTPILLTSFEGLFLSTDSLKQIALFIGTDLNHAEEFADNFHNHFISTDIRRQKVNSSLSDTLLTEEDPINHMIVELYDLFLKFGEVKDLSPDNISSINHVTEVLKIVQAYVKPVSEIPKLYVDNL